jgi:hypothetical protein
MELLNLPQRVIIVLPHTTSGYYAFAISTVFLVTCQACPIVTILMQELDANLIAKLPTEVVHCIFLTAASHLDIALNLMPVSSWVYCWIAPVVYRRAKLATDDHALNFLSAMERTHPVEPRKYVRSIIIPFAAPRDVLPPAVQPGGTYYDKHQFRSDGVSVSTFCKTLCLLHEAPSLERLSVHFSFTFLHPPEERAYHVPPHWGILGFGPVRFTTHGLTRLTHLRLHHSVIFAPVDAAPIVGSMPALTHVAFPFLEDAPLAARIAANILQAPQLKRLLMIAEPANSPSILFRSANFKELLNSTDGRLVILEFKEVKRQLLDDVDGDTLWEIADRESDKWKNQLRPKASMMPPSSATSLERCVPSSG